MGTVDDVLLETAAKVLLRYTKAEPGSDCRIKVTVDGSEQMLTVSHTFSETCIEQYRV